MPRQSAAFHPQAEFEVPLGGRIGRLSVATAGEIRGIELDGQRIGEIGRGSVNQPWREFEFDRNGQSFVVAFRYVFRGLARHDLGTSIEVFADGINLDDGRTLEQWRSEAPKPGDMPFLGGSDGSRLPSIPGLMHLWRYWIVAVAVAAVLAILNRDPWMIARGAAALGLVVAWLESIHLVQRWALRRTDLSEGKRVGAVFGAAVLPLCGICLILALLSLR